MINNFVRANREILTERVKAVVTAYKAQQTRVRSFASDTFAPTDKPRVDEGERGWLPIVLCPTDGKLRALKMPDGTEIVGCFDGDGPGPGRRLGATNRWKRREVAYHNPPCLIGQRGGVDQWSVAYDTYIDSDLPEGVYPTHFRPNDTSWGEPKLTAKIDPDGDDDGPVSAPAPPKPALTVSVEEIASIIRTYVYGAGTMGEKLSHRTIGSEDAAQAIIARIQAAPPQVEDQDARIRELEGVVEKAREALDLALAQAFSVREMTAAEMDKIKSVQAELHAVQGVGK